MRGDREVTPLVIFLAAAAAGIVAIVTEIVDLPLLWAVAVSAVVAGGVVALGMGRSGRA